MFARMAVGNMDQDQTKNAIIVDIYKAAIDPNHWPVVLKHTCRLIDSKAATLLYRDNETRQAGVFHSFNHPPEVMREYLDHYCTLDPTFDLAASRAPIGRAIADRQMASSYEEFRSICGDEFNGFLERHDNECLCGAVLFNSDQQMSALSFQRSRHDGMWTDEQLQDLTELTPHFQRAFTIHREFTRLRIKEQVMQAGIDRLSMGFILFDELLEPVYLNPVAQEILEYHEAIGMNGDVLRAYHAEDSRAIRAGLHKAGSAGDGDVDPSAHATALGLRSPGNPPLPVMIIPVQQCAILPMQRFRHAHVSMLFSDPMRNQPIIPEALQRAYGLTETESHVAIAIANGWGVQEIAQTRGTTSNTVRTQLKGIYAKLSVNRQSELAKAILNGPFQITM